MKTTKRKVKEPLKRGVLLDVPLDIEWDLLRSAQELLGTGYTLYYYASAASHFTWLYEAGVKADRKARRKKVAR